MEDKLKYLYQLLESLQTSSNVDVINVIKQAIPIIFESYINYDTSLHTPRGFQIPNDIVNYQQNMDSQQFIS